VPPARIRNEAELRKQDVAMPGSEDLWTIQPLLDAGLDLDEVGDLLFRFSFECLVETGQCDVWDAGALLPSRSTAVRAAWIETVDRMLRVPEPRIGA
jgi:hypothetical protein